VTASADTRSHDPGAPLAGRSVIVTRTADQARAIVEPLENLGVEVLAFPVIAVVDPPDWGPVDEAIGRLREYQWIVLTSANAVRCFFARLEDTAGGRESLGDVEFAVVGTATASALRAQGIEPHLIPADFTAEGLIEEFRELQVGEGYRVLIPRALEAREVLPDTLREWGATVDIAPVYQTVKGEPDPAVIDRLQAGSVDAATFTSPSTFRNFRSMLQEAGVDADATLHSMALASIGPVTSADLRALGVEPAVEAVQPTDAALVAGIVEQVRGPAR